jgi:diacylglycerol kinase family enzyme
MDMEIERNHRISVAAPVQYPLAMLRDPDRRLLVLNPGAQSVTNSVRDRLSREFGPYELIEFPRRAAWLDNLDGRATVIVCGGDGTVSAVARALAGSPHALGIVPLGTSNNLARALTLSTDLDTAIEIVKKGRPRACTLGEAGGRYFLEAALVGEVAATVALGHDGKDLQYRELAAQVQQPALGRPFRYRVSGDVALEGIACSLAVANAPTKGALLPDTVTTPDQQVLELRVERPETWAHRARHVLGGLRRRRKEAPDSYPIREVRIETEPSVSVAADTVSLGVTPITVRTHPAALQVILP